MQNILYVVYAQYVIYAEYVEYVKYYPKYEKYVKYAKYVQKIILIHNMQNMQNMSKKTILVQKIVYLALRPLFLEHCGMIAMSSSSSVSSAVALLAVFLAAAAAAAAAPAAPAGEGTAGAAGPARLARFLAGSRRLARSASSSDFRESRTLLRTIYPLLLCMHCDRLSDSGAHLRLSQDADRVLGNRHRVLEPHPETRPPLPGT